MIEESRQDLAIEYVLGELQSAAAHDLQVQIQNDAELAGFIEKIRESAAALAHTAPLRRPPPHLREKILSVSRSEGLVPALQSTRHSTPSSSARPAWLPWALAAGFAITTVMLFAYGLNARTDAQRWQTAAAAMERDAAPIREKLAALEAQTRLLAGQTTQLQQQLAALKNRDVLAQLMIASLSAKVAAYAKAGAVVVWDAENQRGVVKLTNLPKAAAGKDYQLWVIDPKYPSPVSAGVVPIGNDGSARADFTPELPIATPGAFAISIERTGGSPKPGPNIILVGN